jgi:hypothetical protein
MAATPSIDVSGWLQEQLAQASPDLLRAMVTTFAGALMSAEADAVCGAGYGERSDQRVTGQRDGQGPGRAASRLPRQTERTTTACSAGPAMTRWPAWAATTPWKVVPARTS